MEKTLPLEGTAEENGKDEGPAKKDKEDEDEEDDDPSMSLLDALKEDMDRGRPRAQPVETWKEQAINECLIPLTLPSKIKVWRLLYCPNDFEPVGETKVIEREMVRLLEEIRRTKERIEAHKDVLDPIRVEKRRSEEEQAKKALEQRRQEKRASMYDIDNISSLDEDFAQPQEE